MIRKLRDNKYLISQLVKKSIKKRYQGSVFGMLWTWIVPILMLTVYTFVFSVVFQARWGENEIDKFQFALMMFCGLSVFNIISDVMSRATVLIASNSNYVKKVIFPLELLPFVETCTALFFCIINLIILVLARLVLYSKISPFVPLVILAIVPVFLFAFGMGLLLSSISVYLKDIGSIISVIIMILMYMSPVFFSLSSVPEDFQIVCTVNPITYMIENMRNILLYDRPLDICYYALSLVAASIVYVIGYTVFKKAKGGFADVV